MRKPVEPSPVRFRIPALEDLLPEEVQYLFAMCRLLRNWYPEGFPELSEVIEELQGDEDDSY